ncbi:hypothetical protein HPB48_021325 [Haemaphysalis longicornis]|uniref:Uncharacterized protein n=1 Tax=Haemaphysalis longicornis TaxID=44386 RepID=A0A9J6FS80_HAELO|nr:hypothetical protein HPB48_021325 [Haemaphysalis longicornis]
MDVCETINGHTHTSKVWAFVQSIFGKRKTNNGDARVAIREGVSLDELAEEAATTFFSHTSHPSATTYNRDNTTADEEAYNVPFTMTELHHALERANARSMPGAYKVCVAHLRSLPDCHKQALPDEINHIWDSGELPKTWKFAIVNPS